MDDRDERCSTAFEAICLVWVDVDDDDDEPEERLREID